MNKKLFLLLAAIVAIFCACSPSKEVAQGSVQNIQTVITDSAEVMKWYKRANFMVARAEELDRLFPFSSEGIWEKESEDVFELSIMDTVLGHQCRLRDYKGVEMHFMFFKPDTYQYTLYINKTSGCRISINDQTEYFRSDAEQKAIIEECYLGFEAELYRLEKKLHNQ